MDRKRLAVLDEAKVRERNQPRGARYMALNWEISKEIDMQQINAKGTERLKYN